MSRRGFLTSTLHYCEQRSQVFFASNPNVRTTMVTWCKRLFATGILLVVSVTALWVQARKLEPILKYLLKV